MEGYFYCHVEKTYKPNEERDPNYIYCDEAGQNLGRCKECGLKQIVDEDPLEGKGWRN